MRVAALKILCDDAIALRLARREVLDRLDRLVTPLCHLACRHLVETRARHALNDWHVVRVGRHVDEARV